VVSIRKLGHAEDQGPTMLLCQITSLFRQQHNRVTVGNQLKLHPPAIEGSESKDLRGRRSMTQKPKEGDIVTLRSGGPKMTVRWVDTRQYSDVVEACCTWFDSKGEPREQTFALSQLTLCDSILNGDNMPS